MPQVIHCSRATQLSSFKMVPARSVLAVVLVALSICSAASAAAGKDATTPGVLVAKLRPSHKRTKDEVVKAVTEWQKQLQKKKLSVENMRAADKDTVTLTSTVPPKVKDFLLEQNEVYEVTVRTGGGSEVFRRPGDIPLKELKVKLAREAEKDKVAHEVEALKILAAKHGITIDTDVAANVVKNLKPGGAPGSKPPSESGQQQQAAGKAGIKSGRSKPTREAGEAEGVVTPGGSAASGRASVEDGYDEVVPPSAVRDEL